VNPLSRDLLRWSALVLGACVAFLGGCASDFSEELRAHTYPPDFNYIPTEKLESTMWQLAEQVDELDELLREATAGDEALQGEVAQRLAAMDQTSKALGQGGWPSNHPQVSRNVETFRLDVQNARRAVEVSPPNYFLAGSIAGACMHCHGPG
jgi:hypothetical protein